MTQEEGYRRFVIGAGFSAPAGLPTGAELWKELLRRGNRSEVFTCDLRRYIEYKRNADGVDTTPESVEFEEFLAFLDIEHHLGLLGSDTWSDAGNKCQVLVKCLIGEILTEQMPGLSSLPSLYLRFAERLRTTDIILTLNYDVLLERSLRAAGVPFRLFPHRYTSWEDDQGEVEQGPSREVVILKLHGSIDWFDRTIYSKLERLQQKQGWPAAPGGFPVFSRPSEFGVTKLLEGPHPPEDPLNSIYRAERIEALYGEHSMFSCPPCLLTPSASKIVYSDRFRTFWFGMAGGGLFSLGMAIVGYSLPPHDSYARQVLYRLVKNYQSRFVEKECSMLGWKQAPLVLVDYRRGAAEAADLLRRYRFVDRDAAVLLMDGFSEATLDTIFQS
ncbi:MAG: hypothetical protein FJ291_25540 [Planctomycetes bacterium]|nr:hypothetical protein [Planctomycetota bacterium]